MQLVGQRKYIEMLLLGVLLEYFDIEFELWILKVLLCHLEVRVVVQSQLKIFILLLIILSNPSTMPYSFRIFSLYPLPSLLASWTSTLWDFFPLQSLLIIFKITLVQKSDILIFNVLSVFSHSLRTDLHANSRGTGLTTQLWTFFYNSSKRFSYSDWVKFWFYWEYKCFHKMYLFF